MSSFSRPMTQEEREEELRKLGEQAIRIGEKVMAERDAMKAGLLKILDVLGTGLTARHARDANEIAEDTMRGVGLQDAYDGEIRARDKVIEAMSKVVEIAQRYAGCNEPVLVGEVGWATRPCGKCSGCEMLAALAELKASQK